jgi:4-amino-4-deoxy-L-arabinose transferase-like glycosyltransferase
MYARIGFRRNPRLSLGAGPIIFLRPRANPAGNRAAKGRPNLAPGRHVKRIGLLMLAATLLLGWLAVHTEIFYTDGLRYIAQARTIDRGSLSRGFLHSVDHPVYPLAIVATHRLIGGDQPRDWQTAAQLAAVISGVLLVIPLYLISLELFGASRAWLSCAFIYLVPFNGHVLADALSESTFLLFWSIGVWSSLLLLRTARLGWLVPVVIASALAYLTRPEGLVVLLSLLATLCVLPFWRSGEFPARQIRWALGLLVVGGLAAAGPFMILKGGISSKPSMSRLLGSAPKADAMAVERERPLEAGQSAAKTVLLSGRALVRAVARATAIPVLLLAPLGILAGCTTSTGRRMWLYLGIMLGLCTFALMRVHVMAGYCTPRHAMVLAWILTIAGGAGLAQLAVIAERLVARLNHGRWPALRIESAVTALAVVLMFMFSATALTAPIDSGFAGYREAGDWIAAKTSPSEHVIDPKGLALFYANETGYTFARLTDGAHDPSVRWLVAHEALLRGPWDYCTLLRELVGSRPPAQTFPLHATRGASRVFVFDLAKAGDQSAAR